MALGNMSPNQDWQSLGAGGLNGYNNQGDYGGPSVRSNLDFQRLVRLKPLAIEHAQGLGTIRRIKLAARD